MQQWPDHHHLRWGGGTIPIHHQERWFTGNSRPPRSLLVINWVEEELFSPLYCQGSYSSFWSRCAALVSRARYGSLCVLSICWYVHICWDEQRIPETAVTIVNSCCHICPKVALPLFTIFKVSKFAAIWLPWLRNQVFFPRQERLSLSDICPSTLRLARRNLMITTDVSSDLSYTEETRIGQLLYGSPWGQNSRTVGTITVKPSHKRTFRCLLASGFSDTELHYFRGESGLPPVPAGTYSPLDST